EAPLLGPRERADRVVGQHRADPIERARLALGPAAAREREQPERARIAVALDHDRPRRQAQPRDARATRFAELRERLPGGVVACAARERFDVGAAERRAPRDPRAAVATPRVRPALRTFIERL